MNPFIRFLQDILGYFMEKFPPLWKAIVFVIVGAIAYFFGGWRGVLNTIAVVLWVISLFMFGMLFYNVIKDRNKEGPSGER